MKTIAFCDFWMGFSPKDYFLPALFPDYTLVSADASPDILIYSIFGDYHHDCVAGKKIHFSGENTNPRPEADLNLTFRLDNPATKNIRLPLWLLYMRHEEDADSLLITESNNPDMLVHLESLVSHHAPYMTLPTCSFVCSNPAPNSPREYLYKYYSPASAGKAYNNTGSHLPDDRGCWNKFLFIRQYNYNICPENSIGEGYTTEKLLHAFAANTIPIYWGWTPEHLENHDFNLEKCVLLLDATKSIFRYGKEMNKPTSAINLDKYHTELCPEIMQKKIAWYL